MVPQVVIVDSIPLLTNGKTDRQTLLHQYETSIQNGNFKTIHETKYYNIVSKVLYNNIKNVF